MKRFRSLLTYAALIVIFLLMLIAWPYLVRKVVCAPTSVQVTPDAGQRTPPDEEFPAWTRWEDAHRRGDVAEVRCYRKKYLRDHIGKKLTRQLFHDNPDARSLCGMLHCYSEFHCRFDALVFVDENPPPRPVPTVRAQTPRPFKRHRS